MQLDGINFNAISFNTIKFSKSIDGVDHDWFLRDDIGSEVGLACLDLMQHDHERSQWKLPSNSEDALALMRQAYSETIAETLDVFTRLWRRTYPDESVENLRHWFTHEERQQIIQFLFTNRSATSLTPSAATMNGSLTPPTSASPLSAPQEAALPNRAQRRRHRHRGMSQGAIPSQKPLLRALGAS